MPATDTEANRRIGFDARLIGALGIGRYIGGLLPALAGLLGSRLTVIIQRQDAALARALIGGSARLITVNAPPYRFAEQIQLPGVLARARVGLVHFPHYNLPILYRGRFVVTIHDLFPFDFPDIHSGPLPRAVNQVLMRNAVHGSLRIITPSKATARALADRFPRSGPKITAIPEAADERFVPIRNSEAEAAWHTRLAIRKPYVFYLGQWKAYKNLPLLIRAFALLRQTHPDVQLVLAGDDPRHPEVRQAAAVLPPGSVAFPGRLPDAAVPDLYRGAAMVILPSRAEGFGLPVIEAMACAVPVICSDLPVLREVADGIATFCSPDDAPGFAAAMAAVLDNPPSGLQRERGRERAHRFSWEAAAERTVALYEESLENRLVGAALEEDPNPRQDQDLQVKG
ncbi:MAG: glycosyltransferase family 4 protein [Chloroflexi bacterium]|nr:MAG: glycosyltransferase family 4 protein [Chloroflexota bacterium]